MQAPVQFNQNAIDLSYFSDFLNQAAADELLLWLQHKLDWQRTSIHLFGRQVLEPRLTAWYADEGVRYAYSGRQLSARPWPVSLSEIRQQINTVAHCAFNAVLGNYYRNGNDHMGWHSDDEGSLGDEPVIASLSLGAERDFILRRKDSHQQKQRLTLQHGSLLIMRGKTQLYWQHALPRRKGVVQPRINLTFRQVLSSKSKIK